MTAQTSGAKPYSLDQLPGIMPKELRECLREAGHKIGNPMPTTTRFKPRKGWKVRINGDHAVMYDPAGNARYKYYPEAQVVRVGQDTPLGVAATQPWLEIIPRYDIRPFDPTRCQAFDRKIGQPYGGLHRTVDGVINELNQNKPGWQHGKYWEDEVPKKWWQRLLFWRRDDKFATSPEELEQRLQFGENHGPDAMTVSGQTNTTAD